MISHSNEVARCAICSEPITARSAFAAVLKNSSGMLVKEVVAGADVSADDCAVHMSGDRECGRPSCSYRRDVREALGLDPDYSLADYFY